MFNIVKMQRVFYVDGIIYVYQKITRVNDMKTISRYLYVNVYYSWYYGDEGSKAPLIAAS